MNTKHTPGPLHVFSVYAQHEVRTPTDTLVAVVNSRDDARLFSAAPELLEAAELGLHYIEAVCFNTPNPKKRENYARAASKIRAAIVKATGASHVHDQ